MASGQDKADEIKLQEDVELGAMVEEEELDDDQKDEEKPLLYPIEVVIDPQVTFSPYSPMSREGDTKVWPFVKKSSLVFRKIHLDYVVNK